MGLIAPAGPIGASREWQFVFEDRFPSFQYWDVDPSPVAGSNGVPSDGTLASASSAQGAVLRVVPTPSGPRGVRLNTRQRVAVPRGQYVEFKAKLPHQTSVWPALWTMADPWPAPGEADVMEVLTNAHPRTVEGHWHSSFDNLQTAAVAMEDADVVWHTYGVWRRKGSVTWYYDGHQVGRFVGNVPDRSHWLCMDVSVLAGNHVNYEDRMRVRQVRVFA